MTDLIEALETIAKFIPKSESHSDHLCSCERFNEFYEHLQSKNIDVSNCYIFTLMHVWKYKNRNNVDKLIFVNQQFQKVSFRIESPEIFECDDKIMENALLLGQQVLKDDVYYKFVIKFLFDHDYVLLGFEDCISYIGDDDSDIISKVKEKYLG